MACVQVAYECLMRAVKICKPKTRYRDIGDVVSAHASRNGCSVVRTYCGHGICDLFHCKPNVPHYARSKAKGVMEV
jgi:methionyl aminopeptidase